MTATKSRKKLMIIGIVIAAIAVIAGIVYFIIRKQQDKKSVEVIPVAQIATEDYWANNVSSSGMATSDYIQEIYPEADKIISEIFVKEGDTVKIGDPLLQYDKTLLELALEKKKLELQSADEDIRLAEKDLIKLKNTSPYVPPVIPPPTAPPTPTPIPPADANVILYEELNENSIPYAGSGTKEDPYRYLCTENAVITKGFLLKVFGLPTSTVTQPVSFSGTSAAKSHNLVFAPMNTTGDSLESEFLQPTTPPTSTPTPTPQTTPSPTPPPEITPPPETTPPSETTPTPPPETTPPPASNPFVAVLEVREKNSNHGDLIHSFEIDGLSSTLPNIFSPQYNQSSDDVQDDLYSDILNSDSVGLDDLSDTSNDEIQYTAEELKQAIAEKEAEIKTLRLSRKQMKIDYDKAELQVNNTTVTSTIDGVVRSLISIEDAQANSQPFLVVSGENTFYLHGTLNESLLYALKVGDTITVNSWETGSYEAQIVSISNYPVSSNGYYGGVNPNTSSYQFTAVFSNTDGIYNGMHFDIDIRPRSSDETSETFYIEKMYVRDDDGGSYVMKKGEKGRLTKQYIQTGKIISSGYMIEIKSGLTMQDSIAFPYGKDLREGMRTRPQGTDENYQEDEASGDNSSDTSSPPEGETLEDEVPHENEKGIIGGTNTLTTEDTLAKAAGVSVSQLQLSEKAVLAL